MLVSLLRASRVRSAIQLLFLLFMFVLNGFFLMSEMDVLSSRKAWLQQLHDEGHAGSEAALGLANQPSHFLSTIQVGIAVIGNTSGVVGEVALSARVAQWISQQPVPVPITMTIATTLVIAGTTVGQLIIGELFSNRLALVNPEAVASIVTKPMQWLTATVYPMVRALNMETYSVLWRVVASFPVSEKEIQALMEQSAEAGLHLKEMFIGPQLASA